MARTKPYKALTVVNIPFNDDPPYRPGEMIPAEELQAVQTDEQIKQLVDGGAIGEEGDDIDVSHIIPDPTMPSIQSVVAQAQAMVDQLTEAGEPVPKELKAVAE